MTNLLHAAVLTMLFISATAFGQDGQSPYYAKARDLYLDAASKTKCPDRAKVLNEYADWNQCMVDVLAGRKSSCGLQPTTPVPPCNGDATGGSTNAPNQQQRNNTLPAGQSRSSVGSGDAVGNAIGVTLDLINQAKRNKWNREYLEKANQFQAIYGITIDALERAIEENDTNAFSEMLKKGFDRNIDIINQNQTLLYYATDKNRFDMVKMLLLAGVEINKINPKIPDHYSGITPLHSAAFNGNLELTKLLVENGADLNAQIEFWRITPLFEAIKKNRLDIIRYLVSKGADLSLTIKYESTLGIYRGLTPVEYANKLGFTEAAAILY